MGYRERQKITRSLVYRAFGELYITVRDEHGYDPNSVLSDIEIMRLSVEASKKIVPTESTRQVISSLEKKAFSLAKKLEANRLNIESIL